jgi:hypothetical protein
MELCRSLCELLVVGDGVCGDVLCGDVLCAPTPTAIAAAITVPNKN